MLQLVFESFVFLRLRSYVWCVSVWLVVFCGVLSWLLCFLCVGVCVWYFLCVWVFLSMKVGEGGSYCVGVCVEVIVCMCVCKFLCVCVCVCFLLYMCVCACSCVCVCVAACSLVYV